MLQPLGMLHRKVTILKDLKPMSWILFSWMKDREWAWWTNATVTCCLCPLWREHALVLVGFGQKILAQAGMCEWHLKYDAYFVCAFDGWAPSIEVHVSGWEVLDPGRFVWSLNQCWAVLDFAKNIQFQF
jgi:hypothetical protein